MGPWPGFYDYQTKADFEEIMHSWAKTSNDIPSLYKMIVRKQQAFLFSSFDTIHKTLV